jgi:tRNA pseudouridine(55) synthase
MSIYIFNKNLGETPLECLNRLRIQENITNDIPITYAGRLDPLATGMMIFLSGDDVKNKDKYTGLDKIYTAEFIIGLSTDTADLLGLLTKYNFDFNKEDFSKEKIQSAFKNLTGNRVQKFHPFSSKVVSGKPLWEHSRNGNTMQSSHLINIYNIDIKSIENISIHNIYNTVENNTKIVNQDFRQQEILNSWEVLKNSNAILLKVLITVHASAGTYIRVLAEELGDILNLPVCVYSINRDEVILPKV